MTENWLAGFANYESWIGDSENEGSPDLDRVFADAHDFQMARAAEAAQFQRAIHLAKAGACNHWPRRCSHSRKSTNSATRSNEMRRRATPSIIEQFVAAC